MKKHGDVTVSMLISIILGIVVIMFLIYGFSTSWTMQWEKMSIFSNADSNIDDVTSVCNIACEQGKEYFFCDEKRELIVGGKPRGEESCEYWAENGEYGIDRCSRFSCDNREDGVSAGAYGGAWS